MTDQNRKTLRSFYCRDYLWEIFEQMTTDLGCSMDYLVNESMRLYARSRDYVQDEAPGAPGMGGPGGGGQMGGGQMSGGMDFRQPPAPGYGSMGGGQPNPPPNQGFSPMEHRTFNQIPPVQQQPRQPAPPAPPQPSVGFSGQRNQLQSAPPPPPPRPGNGGGGWQSGGYQQAPQPAPSPGYGGGSPMPASGAQPPLYLLFNNNRYVVDKEKFVIGRGSQQTDLTIRDGNISRKHCCIVYKNGSYFIKDLNSTNGVEYRGNRIESKKIEEGDIFYLCDYELRFTYRP